MPVGRKLIEAVFLASLPFAVAALGLAQPSSFAQAGETYVPRLGDIMSAIQVRHVKVWYAGKAANWDLAAFELRQLTENLREAAVLYAGIPVSNVTTMAAPLQSVQAAIEAKDVKRFLKEFAEFTAGCNGCHTSMGRSFVVIGTPAEPQPLGDQLFAPRRAR